MIATTARPFAVRNLEGNLGRYGSLVSAVAAARRNLRASLVNGNGGSWSVATVDGDRYVVTVDSVELVRA